MRRFVVSYVVVVLVSLVVGPVGAEDTDLAEYIRAHYTKFEFRIPMRDGVKLFTVAYVPNDASEENAYPMLLARSPYSVGPYGVDRYPESFYVPEYNAGRECAVPRRGPPGLRLFPIRLW